MVDNDVYTNTTSRNETGSLILLPDLKDQIEQWIQYEESQGTADDDDEFIFAITVGFWDLWQYATLDLHTAQDAVSESIYTIFEQLNNITNYFDEPPRIIVPRIHDVTFTPLFQSLADSGNLRAFSEAQHKMIYMTAYWNTLLIETAATWAGGRFYSPDWHTWLSDEVRVAQMHSTNTSKSSITGDKAHAFQNVTSPCVSSILGDVEGSGGTSIVIARCNEPREFLFW